MLYQTPFTMFYTMFITVIAGLCMGSFLNCMAWRMTHGESVLKGHSHCTTCGHALAIKDLVPVFSWLFQKGECRYCGDKISARYPFIEMATAMVYVAIVLRFNLSITAVEMLVLASILICITLTDIEDYLIPNSLVLAGIVANIVFRAVIVILGGFSWQMLGMSILEALVGGLSVAVPLLVIVLIADKLLKKESMGGGDIKLFFMVGMYFMWQQNVLILIISCIFGIIFGLISMRGTFAMDKPFPFGPSIALATFTVMMVGNQLLTWYIGFF